MSLVFLVLAALLAGFLTAVALKPARYEVVRNTRIATAPASIFPLIDDLHQWERWSPWAKLDPAMQTSYEGPRAGPGSIYRWKGNQKVGEGTMTILESKPNDSVRIKVEFIKPMPGISDSRFNLIAEDSQTVVFWIMSGESGFVSRLFVTLMGGMDRMIGKDFEKGLAQLKALAESGARPSTSSASA